MGDKLILVCRGKKYVADNDFYYNYALELEDTGTALNNPRSKFIINNFEHFNIVQDGNKKHRVTNTVDILYSLSQEINRCKLSYEDEQYLDDIIGNDPMCMF